MFSKLSLFRRQQGQRPLTSSAGLPCAEEEEASAQQEASANGNKGKQHLEPAVVQNGFVTRSSGHSSGSESRSIGGQSSMQSIPEGKPDQARRAYLQ